MVPLQQIPERVRESELTCNGPFANMWTNKHTDHFQLPHLIAHRRDRSIPSTKSALPEKGYRDEKSDHDNRGTSIRIANPDLDEPNGYAFEPKL